MVLTLTIGTSGSNSSPDYSLANLILMGVYVAATLALVGISIWQARAALTASAKQSQAAIDAVYKQITADKPTIRLTFSYPHPACSTASYEHYSNCYCNCPFSSYQA